MPYLSVILPVYNEAHTIKAIVEKVAAVPVDKEIIVVDNASTDGTAKLLRELRYPQLKVIHHVTNRGKGGGVITGLANATGEYCIIQDGDLEYDPQDYLKLLAAIREDKCDVVLGARFTQPLRLAPRAFNMLGNRILTWYVNVLFGAHLNDSYTCYKLAPRSVYQSLHLSARGFDIEAEIVCKTLKKKLRLVEVPITYIPRTYKEGKKIRWWDCLWGMWYIGRYRFARTA